MSLCDVCALEPPSSYCCEGQGEGCMLCLSCYGTATRVGKRKRNLLLSHRLEFRPRWLKDSKPAYSGRFCPASVQSRYWPWRRQRAEHQLTRERSALMRWRQLARRRRALRLHLFTHMRSAFMKWRKGVRSACRRRGRLYYQTQ